MTVGNGTRSSRTSVHRKAESDVLINAHVTRILRSSIEHNHVPPTFGAVEFTQDAGANMHILAPSGLEKIILSAGTVGTRHIFLNSGIGGRTELSAHGIKSTLHMPDVGKNMTDHPKWDVEFSIDSTDTMENIYFRNATYQAEALAEWEANRTGFLAAGIANQLRFLCVPENILHDEPCAGNETTHYEFMLLNDLISDPVPPTGNFLSIRTVVLCPLSRGDVTLNSPLAPPVINPNFFAHPQDLTIHAGGYRCCKKVCQGSGMGWIRHWRADGRLRRNIRIGVATIYHLVGTASTSPADMDWGVANPDLKLKGAKGVRIVDASVLPFVTTSHIRTQAPVYAMAERAADLIRGSK